MKGIRVNLGLCFACWYTLVSGRGSSRCGRRRASETSTACAGHIPSGSVVDQYQVI